MNEQTLRRMYAMAMIEVGGAAPASVFDQPLDAVSLKFAESIVKACGNWFNDRLVVNPDYGLEHRVERNRAVVGVMKEFNTHFGVEQ